MSSRGSAFPLEEQLFRQVSGFVTPLHSVDFAQVAASNAHRLSATVRM